MVQYAGERISTPSGGSSMPSDLASLLTQAFTSAPAGGGASQQSANIVPLWRARPTGPSSERVNPGMIGEDSRSMPSRITVPLGNREMYTPTFAASAFLDMDDDERADFARLAIASGLIRPGTEDPDALANAWRKAVGYAADYNGDRDESKWISPWEAVTRLGVQNAAREGGSYNPFKPRTLTNTQKIRRDFLSGEGAESVTRTLEALFNSEMGRAPTDQERAIYQKLVQRAYDESPEIQKTTTTTDAEGNQTSTAVQSGGIDATATLLDKVREDPETQAFDAGSTFFEAAMRALGAIA